MPAAPTPFHIYSDDVDADTSSIPDLTNITTVRGPSLDHHLRPRTSTTRQTLSDVNNDTKFPKSHLGPTYRVREFGQADDDAMTGDTMNDQRSSVLTDAVPSRRQSGYTAISSIPPSLPDVSLADNPAAHDNALHKSRRPRPPFRSPSSVRAMQLTSPSPLASPRLSRLEHEHGAAAYRGNQRAAMGGRVGSSALSEQHQQQQLGQKLVWGTTQRHARDGEEYMGSEVGGRDNHETAATLEEKTMLRRLIAARRAEERDVLCASSSPHHDHHAHHYPPQHHHRSDSMFTPSLPSDHGHRGSSSSSSTITLAT